MVMFTSVAPIQQVGQNELQVFALNALPHPPSSPNLYHKHRKLPGRSVIHFVLTVFQTVEKGNHFI